DRAADPTAASGHEADPALETGARHGAPASCAAGSAPGPGNREPQTFASRSSRRRIAPILERSRSAQGSVTQGGAMRSAQQYLDGLRDGREVWYRGERVDDVTAHPELGIAARHAA